MSADLGTDWRRLAEKQAESLKEAAETVESLRQRLQRLLEEVREEFADDIGNHAAPEWVERLVAEAGVPDRGDEVSDVPSHDWVKRMDALARELRGLGATFDIRVRIDGEEAGYWYEAVKEAEDDKQAAAD